MRKPYRDRPWHKLRRISLVDLSIVLIIFGLLAVSAYATYEGIHDLILAERPAGVDVGDGAAGNLYIFLAVALLTVAMWVALEIGLRRGNIFKRMLCFTMYAVLALWSIGFGYGYWWKVIVNCPGFIGGGFV